MSPALVDAGAQAATAPPPRTLPKQTAPSPRNPSGGETLPEVAPSAIPFSSDPTAAMDAERRRNAGESNLESVFSMLFPPPKVDKAAPSGLSRPRFVKVRRHFASPRVRPGSAVFADSEDVTDPGFNPFRSVPPPAGNASGQVATEGADHSSSGFAFGRSSNSGTGDGAVSSAKDDSFIFTFGGTGNFGGVNPAMSENANFVSAAGRSTGSSNNSSHLGSSVAGDEGNDTHKFATVGRWSSASETVPSVGESDFGTRAKSSCIGESFASWVPDGVEQNDDPIGKTKEPEYITQVDQKKTYVFGGGHSVGSSGVNSAHKPPEVMKRTDTGRGTTLQPGNNKKQAMPSSSHVGKSATCELPEEMQKLNINSSKNADNVMKAKAGDPTLEAGDGGTFIFGTNKNVSSSFGQSNSMAGAFVFGSSSQKSGVPDPNSTDGSDKSSARKLPEEMQKLNIKDSTLKDRSTDTENASLKFTTGGNCSSGAETITNDSMSDFGMMGKRNYFDESLISRLPDEMRNLNIEVPSGVDGFEKMKGPCSEDDLKKFFVFGSNQNIGSSHENYASELPEEFKTANTGRGTIHQPENGKEEDVASSAADPPQAFMFRNNSKNSTLSGQNPVDGFDRSTTSKLPQEMQKLNVGESGNADDIGKAKAENGILEAIGSVFVFGSSKNVSASFGEGSSTAGVFVVGSSSKKNNVPDLNAFDGSHKSSMTDNTGASVSGSNKNISHSFGERKLVADDFVFGSSSTQGTSFCSGAFDGFDQKTFNKLPDEMQKLNIRGSGLEKTQGGDHSSSNNAFVPGNSKGSSASSSESNSTAGVFVFGSSSNEDTVYNQGMADWFDEGNRLPDEMQKLNVRANANAEETKSGPSETGASVSMCNNKIPASCGHGYSTTGMSTPLQFSFHVINQDGRSDVGGVPSAPADHYDRSTSDTNASSCSSSFGSVSQSSGCDPTFAGYHEGLGMPTVNFNTTKRDTSWYSKDSLFSASCQNAAFNVKKGVSSHSRLRKRRVKLRDSTIHFQRGGKGFTSIGKSSQANSELDSPEDYSPMDFSPCQLETPVAEECSREASVAAGESIHLRSHHSSTGMQNSVSVSPRDDDLVNATECLDTNEELLNLESHDGDSKPHAETGMAAEPSFVEERVSGIPSKMDLGGKNDSGEAGVNTTTDFSSSEFEKQTAYDGNGFIFSSCSNDVSESSFTFSASPSTRDSLSESKHIHRRKFRMKVGRDPFISNSDTKEHFPSPNVQLFPDVSISSQLDSTKAQPEVLSVSQCLEGKKLEINKKPQVRQEDSSTAATRTAGQEACEKWRLRGNQAYANGDLSKAEEYYTRGVNSISSNETSLSCTRALMLCYSNRAAARMSIGRIKDALCDCVMAVAIDPTFLRAQLRAANCHLLLGDIEDACNHFEKCLPKGGELFMDRKFILEASDGLQKAKQAADYVERAVALLRKRTTHDAISALQIISDALSLSPYSESLMEMKAGALLMLRRYDELIQLCDQTLESTERNSRLCIAGDQFSNKDNSSKIQSSPARSWRCHMKSRAYFCLGKLEEALTLLQEHQQVGGPTDRSESKSESLIILSTTVSELLRLKVAGNSAFKAGRHSEAVEHYTAALAYNIESRPFAAVCFCNRGAAYQALGQIMDAISDCSLAIALDPDYPKAISRRATLHEMIRDYGQASSDLRRLVSLLERKLEDLSGGKRTTSNGDDPELARLRLAKVEEKARREIPLDMYMILGIDSSSDAAEIKKAYRKAALRHHPDKAGQFLVRSENTDEGLWKEVASEVHRDADHLFKTIGEAYAVLSDPSKRLQYDTEEEIRASQKSNSGTSTPRTQPDYHSSHFERGNRWQSRDNWKPYGNSNQRSGSYQRTSRYY